METTTEMQILDTDTTISLQSAANLLYDVVDDDHQGGNQITFEIPSNVDLERIKNLDNFTNLLHRISNSVLTASGGGGGNSGHNSVSSQSLSNSIGGSLGNGGIGHEAVAFSSDGHVITKDQISGSVVLNLADLQNSGSFLDRFFNGADMHSIINYLWIGVVTSLIVLSVIFIIFSCYFYRKFREWKKCNKDIRSHLNGDLYPNGTTCGTAGGQSEASYYQMESPPCYTIATGLPSYDEALHHQTHFAFGMKFLYPVCPAPMVTVASSAAWEKSELAGMKSSASDSPSSLQLHQHSQRWQNVDSVAATTLLPTSHIRSIKESRSHQMDAATASVMSRNFYHHSNIIISSSNDAASGPGDECSEVCIDA
ncbi:protein commissureless 1 [Eupeodes corollae]|uniref:protein commissureless 1 n=1 Tax=Eupeodes corollae TaxID=290404 RepID=UPI0024939016|nr:protein commissureless 1 [Eupeodes corollae]